MKDVHKAAFTCLIEHNVMKGTGCTHAKRMLESGRVDAGHTVVGMVIQTKLIKKSEQKRMNE